MNSSVEAIYGELPKHWDLASIGDLVKSGKANIQTGPFGTMLHASSYKLVGTPVVAVKHIGKNRLLHSDDLPRIDKETRQRLSRYELETGDILFGRKGAVERRAIVTEKEKGWLQGSDCIRLRLINNEIFPIYISYVLGSRAYHNWIIRNAQGATMPSLNQEIISRIPLPLPPLPEQKSIAHILGSLDDKIELNRQMNQTLEAIAKAIFKSWFVDFDPVRAKMEGRQPAGMDAATAELFPAEFEESALGLIPKGWNIKKLGDLIDIKHGYAFKGEFFHTEPPGDILLTPGNFAIGGGFKDDKFKYYVGEVPEDFVLDKGGLLVTMTDLSKAGDTLGYPAIIPEQRKGRYLHNQRLGKVNIKSDTFLGKLYLYYLLCTNVYRNEVLATATGSTVKHTSPDRIKAFEYPFPNKELFLEFEKIISPLHEKIDSNQEQSRILASMRDILLPKLLSGEISYSELNDIQGGLK